MNNTIPFTPLPMPRMVDVNIIHAETGGILPDRNGKRECLPCRRRLDMELTIIMEEIALPFCLVLTRTMP